MNTSLRDELAHARRETDRLFDLIAPETLYHRPIPERNRLIFYLGHFEAFDWNVLARRLKGEKSFHPTFDALFERGIDPPPGEAPSDSPSDWPALDEVARYKAQTRAWVDRHFDDLDPLVLQMAIEHRHMHSETFAYLLHSLPPESKRAPEASQTSQPRAPRAGTSPPSNPMIDIARGPVTLGKTPEGFGWDNEHLAHQVDVPAFRISRRKISNAEYLEFVREGGPVPHFWSPANGAQNGAAKSDHWLFRGMFQTMPLPLAWPVWVTWDQAAAFAQWRGLSLPSEAQWQRAAALTSPDPRRDNFNYLRWDPVPVDASDSVAPPDAPVQMNGNGWEWTRDLFAPFAGFAPHPFYPGYSADFFDNRHYVMKGASPRTARLLTRPTFRNWFRPDYPYMYAGFRTVENSKVENSNVENSKVEN